MSDIVHSLPYLRDSDANLAAIRRVADRWGDIGVVFMRATLVDENEIVVEGWYERPADQGPPPT
jgi:hypothetical protein